METHRLQNFQKRKQPTLSLKIAVEPKSPSCRPSLPCLPNVRSRKGQPCSLVSLGEMRVQRPARRILIRLRGRVLRISPQTNIGPLGCGPLRERVWHLCRSSSRGARSRSRYRSPSRRSRRLDGAARRNTSSAGYSLLVLRRAAPPKRRTAPRRVTPLNAQTSSALPHYDSFLCIR